MQTQQSSDDLIDNTDLPAGSPCFNISIISLTPSGQLTTRHQKAGANVLPQDPFHFAYLYLQNYTGRCIGTDGINLILKRLTARILERGYSTTRVGVSEQGLSQGSLTFTLVPGIIRAIRFSDASLYGTWRNAFPTGPGKLLNLRDLEQGLEQMKRVPDQDVDMQIMPTDVPGESDIVLNVRRGKPWKLIANYDNSGSDGTGKKQGGVTVAVDNPTGLSDLLNVGINSDADHEGIQRGTTGHSLYYSIPFGYTTNSISASDYQYHQQIAGIGQTYLSSGKSKNLDVKTDYLFQRDQSQKNSLRFDLGKRWSSGYLDDVQISAQERDVTFAELAWLHTHYLGQAQLDFALSSRYGTSWFGGQSDAPGRPGDYPTYAYTIQTLDATFSIPWQVKDQQFSYNATLRAQTTHSPLYLVDQFSIGGRYTVRGFDGELTLTAERGYYLRNELTIPIAQSGSAVYLAADVGKVFGPGVQNLVGNELIGAAIGMRGNFNNLTYDVFTNWPISEPAGFDSAVPAVGFSFTLQY